MTRYRKLHIFDSLELRRAILDGVAVAALCGASRVRTKEDIEAIKDLTLPACKKCADRLAEMTKKSNVVLRERKGWDAFERDTRPAANYRVSISLNGQVVDWSPPLAS